jgi:hypothetical protein
MKNIKLVTAYAVRNIIFPTESAAELARDVIYKGDTVVPIAAIEFNGYIYPTNPLIPLREKSHGNE